MRTFLNLFSWFEKGTLNVAQVWNEYAIPPFDPKVLEVAQDQALQTVQAWTLSHSIC